MALENAAMLVLSPASKLVNFGEAKAQAEAEAEHEERTALGLKRMRERRRRQVPQPHDTAIGVTKAVPSLGVLSLDRVLHVSS